MLQRTTLGTLTQGTIFCCAKAEDYLGCKVFGLVITARCDVANDKTPIYTYLPVVTLRDWLDRDGGTLVASRAANEALGAIRQELKSAGHSPGILKTESMTNIINVLFPVVIGNKTAVAARDRMTRAAERFTAATNCMNSPFYSGRASSLIERNPGIVKGLIGELTTHRLTGYYFISQTDVDGPDAGYVIQLREVNSLPRPVAMSVAGGIDLSLVDEEHVKYAAHFLGAGDEPYAMPVGQISSPTIEHILQQFSLTFSRIGVTDVPQDYVNDVLIQGIFSAAGDTK